MSQQKRGAVSDKTLEHLKAGGFIRERGKNLYTVRLRVPGGRMPVDRLRTIAEVASKYCRNGMVHLSVRQSLELINVSIDDFDAVVSELSAAGQKVATCGARVRVPVACGGCEYNPNGLVDTQQSALEVDRTLFARPTGLHKFKVAFAGCPFDCPKSATNDIGFQGAVQPLLDEPACTGCGLCARSCTPRAIGMDDRKRPHRFSDRCICCGDCIKVCPTGAWREARRGYTVRIGGKWGRSPLVGTLYATFLPEGLVVPFIEAVLEWYQTAGEGKGRVRLGDIIRAEGPDSLLRHLRSRFPDHVVEEALPPHAVPVQWGTAP